MNIKLSLILGLVSGLMMLYWLQTPDAKASGWGEDLYTTIQKVAEDYRKEQWFHWQCYIGGTPVTLAQMLYGLGVAEWGFLFWSAWMRTKNPWSLHKEMWVKKAIWTEHIDNAKKRPVYKSMYDWLYEKAHLIASPQLRYKCNYTFESAFAYTSWPNAERTEERIENARNHLNNALRGAMKFANNPETVVEANQSTVINTYEIARQASIKRQNVEKALSNAITEEHKARKNCIDSKQCN